MNKKILVIGCSFSCFNQQLGSLTWPKILSEKTDWHIYNSSIHGNSLQNQLYQLDYYLKDYNFDFIIFQATTSARDTFIIDEKKYLEQLSNFEQQSENYFTNFFYWEPPTHYVYNLTAPWKPSNEFEKKIKKLHMDNLVYNIHHFEPLLKGLMYEIYRRLNESKIPYLLYTHINYSVCSGMKKNNIIPFPYFDFCLQQKLGREKFAMFRIDSGHHFSDEGNYCLVNDYIYPKIEKYL